MLADGTEAQFVNEVEIGFASFLDWAPWQVLIYYADSAKEFRSFDLAKSAESVMFGQDSGYNTTRLVPSPEQRSFAFFDPFTGTLVITDVYKSEAVIVSSLSPISKMKLLRIGITCLPDTRLLKEAVALNKSVESTSKGTILAVIIISLHLYLLKKHNIQQTEHCGVGGN